VFWHDSGKGVLWVGCSYRQKIFAVNNYSTLLKNTIRSFGSGLVNVPEEFIFKSLKI